MKAGRKKKKRGFGRALLRLLGALLALIVLAAAVLVLVPLTEGVKEKTVPGSADWMAGLEDDLRINRIVLPGSHDSATRNVQLAFFSKCQALSVGKQLEAGCRYLDIRLGADTEKGGLKLMHGFTNCKPSALSRKPLYLDALLQECYAFLGAHPSETVIFAVKQEHGEESVAEFESILDAYIQENEEFWLLTDTLPTLGEARGKLVLTRRYEDALGLGAHAGIPLLWEDQKGHGNTSFHTAAQEQGSYQLWVQDRFEYGTEDKWNAFEKGMAYAREMSAGVNTECVALNFLSTKGTATYGHPYRYAKELNARLLNSTDLSGWIVLDFFDARLASHIYSMN